MLKMSLLTVTEARRVYWMCLSDLVRSMSLTTFSSVGVNVYMVLLQRATQ